MKVVIAGGTGFLGGALADALEQESAEVVILTRNQSAGRRQTVQWRPDGTVGPWAAEIEGAYAIVNLAGESIAGRRWSALHKQHILTSRVMATRSLVEAVNGAKQPPAIFVSGSAVGYYGPLGAETATEEHPAGSDFLAGVCRQWEAEAARVVGPIRLACIRTGLVLSRDGGALPRMLPPFWFGAGGPVGPGTQYWPWIHRQDWIDLVRWIIHTPGASGAFNVTAPAPVTNAAFASALGRALHRPAVVPAPAFALRLLLGEMADALLLSGQRAVPAKAESLGFPFTYPRVDEALGALFGR